MSRNSLDVKNLKPEIVSLSKLLVPFFGKNELNQFIENSILISRRLRSLKLSSLHLSSSFARLIIFNFNKYNKNPGLISLNKEHGSSFFLEYTNNNNFVESLKCNNIYRKNYPKKSPLFLLLKHI